MTALLLCTLNGCDKSGQLEDSFTPAQPKVPLTVNVVQLVRANGTVRTSTYFGTLQPRRSRTLGFSVAGQIKTLVDRFEKVTGGEILAALDVATLEEQRRSLQAALEQSQNQPGDQRTPQLQQQIASLDLQIEASLIRAPYDCIVDETYSFENSLVRPQTPVLKIMDVANPRIQMNLPRRIVRLIQPNRDFFFFVDGGTLTGRLAEKSINEIPSGSITVWFDVVNDLSQIEFAFRESVEAQFNFQTENSGFWLPLSALSRNADGLWSVFAISEDSGADARPNQVVRKLVRIVQVSDELALVDGDLAEGELVVANGIHRVVPGQAVKTNLISSGENVDAPGAAE